MAFITEGITNWVGGYVDQAVGGALKVGGGIAGDAVGAVGNGINSFGGGIEKSVRRYGDGVKDYGNAIKDYTNADGPRNTSAANPLGLPSSISGGKPSLSWTKPPESRSVKSSPAYVTPSSFGTRAGTKPSQKALTAPAKKTTASQAVKRVPIAGAPVKKKSLTGQKSIGNAKPTSNTVSKRVAMAGAVVTRDQALGKKK